MKTVLLAGGSGGMGSAVARQAARSGWSVIVGYNHGRDRAENLVKEIVDSGQQASSVRLALDDSLTINRALEVVADQGGTLQALVLAASQPPVLKPFLKIGQPDFTNELAVNLLGTQVLIAESWKRFFRRNGGGHVIAVLSAAAGAPPWGNMCSYVVAKRALQALLECAAVELGDAGLRVSVISPSYTETPMLLGVHPLVLGAARAKQRFLLPDEVARRIVASLENPPPDSNLQTLKIDE